MTRYTIDRPPAILDVGIGQNEVVTRGRLSGAVLRLEGFYPLPVQQLQMFYLFGRASMRLAKRGFNSNYILAKAPADTSFPSASVANVIVPAPDRDVYTVGIGIDMVPLIKKLVQPPAAK